MRNYWFRCSRCGQLADFCLTGGCHCGGTFLVEYDLEQVQATFTKAVLPTRTASMWRYEELLPVRNRASIVTLGEGFTPLLPMEAWKDRLSLQALWVKREDQNPTGSFKSRGFAAAVSLLKEHGLTKAAVPSNGNAASALAAYAGRAGIAAYVFVPLDCPDLIVQEAVHYGAKVFLVDGLIHDAGMIVEQGSKEGQWFNVGTLKEPGRVEGKKTMGYELAEQLDWELPDVIIYPTGGGSGIIGLWKAFRELEAMGWLKSDIPRLVSVQEEGCAPIAEAMASGSPYRPLPGKAESSPTGLRVPQPPDGDLIVSILRETSGTSIAVSSDEMQKAETTLGAQGISASPEGAATFAALLRLCDNGWIRKQERVVLFNTAHAMKYVSLRQTAQVPVIQNYAQFLAWQARTS